MNNNTFAKTEMFESEHDYIIVMDVPGCKAEHVQVGFYKDRDFNLSIRIDRKRRPKFDNFENYNTILSERKYIAITSLFHIENVDNIDNMVKKVIDGVLYIKIFKIN